MKPKRNIMKEFRMDEISAVDRPAQQGARAVIMKRETCEKRLAMTTMSAGHAHLIVGSSSTSEGLGDLRAGKTAYADGHVHDWMMDDAGNIIIGDAQGHTHGIAAIVMKDNSIVEVIEPPKDADAGRTQDSTVGESSTMTNQDVKVAELETLRKRAERAEKVAELSDTQKVYLKGLKVEEQERFLALTDEGRTSEIAKSKADDEVLFRDADGNEYRKSDDPRLVAMARQNAAERLARQAIEKRAQDAELNQLVSELNCLPGEDADRKVLLKSVLALPEATRDSVLKTMRLQNAALSKAFTSLGAKDAPKNGDAESELDVLAKSIREKNPKLTEAQAMVKAMESPEGLKLYAKHIGA